VRITVADTGHGLKPGSAKGLGLANIRSRLEALYGERGRLILTENQPTGIKAVIEVPYDGLF
jgi:LytS/YehU family sensor histidine kinase